MTLDALRVDRYEQQFYVKNTHATQQTGVLFNRGLVHEGNQALAFC